MKKRILAISGSIRSNSSNIQIINAVKNLYSNQLDIEIFSSIANLPHFNPDLDNDDLLPEKVKLFRKKIAESDGVLISTPEYIFSIPGCLKSALEWTVGSMVLSEKPLALITASGLGNKAHEELLMIMKTIYGNYQDETQLLISGARLKVNDDGFIDEGTRIAIENLMIHFITMM